MEKYINQILENNNRVIVPDFGAFIVKQRKPLIIVFNEFLQYNDGMLVDTVAKSEDLEKEKAKVKIDAFVKSVIAKLDKGDKYPLNKLGILIMNASGKITLEGDDVKATAKPSPVIKTKEGTNSQEKKSLEKNSQADKLQETKIKAEQEKKASEAKVKEEKKLQEKKASEAKLEEEKNIKEEKDRKANEMKLKAEEARKLEAEQARNLQKEKTKTEQPVRATASPISETPSYSSTVSNTEPAKTKSSNRKIVLWVIIIILINGTLITGYFMYNKDIPSFFKKSATEETLMEELIIEEDNYVTESFEDVAETPTVKEEIPEEKNTPTVTTKKAPIQSGTKYYVIAGAFSIEQNADNLVIDLRKKGYNSEKFGKIGRLHAVSYDVFNNKSDADRLMKKLQDETDPQVWIKKAN